MGYTMTKIKKAIGFIRETKTAFSRSHKNRATFRFSFIILREFGLKGLIKAIKNKASGRETLDGLVNSEQELSIESVYFGSINIPGDNIGRKVLRLQQEEFLNEMQIKAGSLNKKLQFSILLPLEYSDNDLLLKTIKSLKLQVTNNWELWALDFQTKDRRTTNLFLEEMKNDSRLHLEVYDNEVNKAEAINKTLYKTNGEFVVIMSLGDQLMPDSLFWLAEELENNEAVDLIYSDECNVDRNGNLFKFFFKPDWSPLLLVNKNYIGKLTAYRKDTLIKSGGFDKSFPTCLDYDIALRFAEAKVRIQHVERVLYKTFAVDKSLDELKNELNEQARILFQHCQRFQPSMSIYERDGQNHIAKWRNEIPLVSIIIITDDLSVITRRIPQLIRDTTYSNYEIIIVANSDLVTEVRKAFAGLGDRLILCTYDGIFNLSRKCNIGAKAANGEYLLFIRDDLFIAQRDWLNHLIDVLDIPGVGATSPSIINTEGKVIYNGGRITQNSGDLYESNFSGQLFYSGDNRAITSHMLRETSVLSKYCISVRKNVFIEIGGFDEINTPNRHCELDFSLRLQSKDLQCVYVPMSVLYHENRNECRENDICDSSYVYMIKRWHNELKKDKFSTDSMYYYSIDSMDSPNRLYLPDNIMEGTKGNILLISHELSRTGSPQVLFEAAKVLKDQGYFSMLASPEDGPLTADILEENIPVIIDKELSKYRAYRPEEIQRGMSQGIDSMLHSFDLVIVASIVNHNLINYYNGSDIKFIWWIHEGWMGFDLLKKYLPKHLAKNVSVYCGGKYSQKITAKYRPNYRPKELLYGLKDRATSVDLELKREKLLFLFPATIESRKNQLLLIKAVNLLPKEIAEKADFLLIGKIGEEIYYRKVVREAEKLPNVSISGPVSYEHLMNIYKETACVILSSIDDPMPVVLTEAMMLYKIVLCSDQTGTASYINDGVNGFVFNHSSPLDLKKKLEVIITNFGELNEVRLAGRKTYEQYFSQLEFCNNLLAAVDNMLLHN